jgi:hypothetical protein
VPFRRDSDAPTPRRRRLALAASALLLLAAAGCAAAEQPRTAGAPRALTAHERERLERTELRLVERCMRARGFPQDAAPRPEVAGVADEHPFGIEDVGWAKRHGLGLRVAERPAPPGEASAADQRESEALYGALDGPLVRVELPNGSIAAASTEGCTADAQRRLYGDFAGWFRTRVVVDNLGSVVAPLLHQDAAFRRAVADWRRCMSAAGHPAADPGELRARVQRRSGALPERRARRLEVAAAVAEARCVTATRLAEAGRSAQQRARARVGHQYRRVLLRHRALQRDALRRVRHPDFTSTPTERNDE